MRIFLKESNFNDFGIGYTGNGGTYNEGCCQYLVCVELGPMELEVALGRIFGRPRRSPSSRTCSSGQRKAASISRLRQNGGPPFFLVATFIVHCNLVYDANECSLPCTKHVPGRNLQRTSWRELYRCSVALEDERQHGVISRSEEPRGSSSKFPVKSFCHLFMSIGT
jgi:hypothetical protein